MNVEQRRICTSCDGIAIPEITTENIIRHRFDCPEKARSIQTYRWAGWADAAIADFLGLMA